MRYLNGDEEKAAIHFLNMASELARKATCLRSKCGTVIIKYGTVIGSGYNSPPKELESQRKCLMDKDTYHKKVADKTCCVHAEQRAIMDALKKNSQELKGSTLYFIRLDLDNNILKAGRPYCTHCSKLALDSGIKQFVLWHEEGIALYDTEEYNELSFKYQG